MQLTDHGPGIADIALAMRAGYSTAPDQVRDLGFGAGMGLPNMIKYSDRFEIDSICRHPAQPSICRLQSQRKP